MGGGGGDGDGYGDGKESEDGSCSRGGREYYENTLRVMLVRKLERIL